MASLDEPRKDHDQRNATPPRSIPLPAHNQLDILKDECGGSEHAGTPPIDIRSGSPVRQETSISQTQDEDFTNELLGARKQDEDALSVGTAPEEDQPLRARGSSISFHPRVTDDRGDHHTLQGVTSNENTPPAGERSTSPAPDSVDFQTLNHQRGRGLHGIDTSNTSAASSGNTRAPRSDITRKIIMGTDTGLSEDSEFLDPSRMDSLLSGSTSPTQSEARTPFSEARTPLHPVNEYFTSPITEMPPQSFPSLDGKGTPARRESRRRDRPEGNRRVSRRSSARSNGPSASSSFLGSFSRSGTMNDMPAVEPDADGQEFGEDDDKYIIGREIGRGGFSIIREAHTQENGRNVVRAVKIVRKKVDGKSEVESEHINSDLDREVDIWRHLNHPYVLSLIASIDTKFATFCVMRYIEGGTLFDMMRAQRRRGRMGTSSSSHSIRSSADESVDTSGPQGLEPATAKRYIYQLASALRYLHEDMHIVHRDVKLENCLLDTSAPDGGNVLLCDFGLADYITSEGRASPPPLNSTDAAADAMSSSMSITVAGGSLPYAAPELIGETGQLYAPAVDMWAFGVCTYTLLAGAMPFSHAMPAKTLEAIEKCEYDIDRLASAYAASEAPDAAVELVRGCLTGDANVRSSIDQVIDCRFLEGCGDLEAQAVEPTGRFGKFKILPLLER